MFDTSGMTASEWEEMIWKKWNMHWDPKKSHWDTYQPPDYAPDMAYEDNWPIKAMKEDAFYDARSSGEIKKSKTNSPKNIKTAE